MTIPPRDIPLCDFLEFTLGKAAKIYLKCQQEYFSYQRVFKILKSYCKKGENIYPTEKEEEGAILFSSTNWFLEEKRQNV